MPVIFLAVVFLLVYPPLCARASRPNEVDVDWIMATNEWGGGGGGLGYNMPTGQTPFLWTIAVLWANRSCSKGLVRGVPFILEIAVKPTDMFLLVPTTLPSYRVLFAGMSVASSVSTVHF